MLDLLFDNAGGLRDFSDLSEGALAVAVMTRHTDIYKDCTGVVLAGGQNRRFGGTNKAFVEIHGKRLLDYILDTFRSRFSETLVVTKTPVAYVQWDTAIAEDLSPLQSSLTGVYTGLFYAATSHAFVTACDTPFIKPEIIDLLLGETTHSTDIVLPETTAGLEPLCAVYSKRCLGLFGKNLKEGRLAVRSAFEHLRVKHIPEKVLRQADPELISLININSPAEKRSAERLVDKGAFK